MPELPEVETVVRFLKKEVLEETFVFVWTEDRKKEKNLALTKGRKIVDIERKGKEIFIFLDNGKVLFVHLKMTGHLLLGRWEKKGRGWQAEEEIMNDPKNGFLRVIFSFKSGKQLALSDPRKFARVEVLEKREWEERTEKLGPDPLLLPEKKFVELFSGKKKKIKPLLMDQGFLSGIGNIYASEILFEAGVLPEKRADALKKEDLARIYRKTKEILKEAIKLKGDSTSDYRLPSGEKGGYQKRHRVYDRRDESCFVCGSEIEWTKLDGRGTYYCPSCQK